MFVCAYSQVFPAAVTLCGSYSRVKALMGRDIRMGRWCLWREDERRSLNPARALTGVSRSIPHLTMGNLIHDLHSLLTRPMPAKRSAGCDERELAEELPVVCPVSPSVFGGVKRWLRGARRGILPRYAIANLDDVFRSWR
jgi:hypothetical protein